MIEGAAVLAYSKVAALERKPVVFGMVSRKATTGPKKSESRTDHTEQEV